MTAKEYIVQEYGETWLRTRMVCGGCDGCVGRLRKIPHRRGRTPFSGRGLNQMQSCGGELGRSHLGYQIQQTRCRKRINGLYLHAVCPVY